MAEEQVTEETGGKITIDPHEIGAGAWEELWNANANDDLDLGSESQSGAEPVEVTVEQAEAIAYACRKRAEPLQRGDSEDTSRYLQNVQIRTLRTSSPNTHTRSWNVPTRSRLRNN